MRRFFVGKLLFLMWMAACTPTPHAPLRLHALFSDHMVLQRDASVPVWAGRSLAKR